MEHEASIARMASYRIHQSLVGKSALKISDFWALNSDAKDTLAEGERLVMSTVERDRILQLHKSS